MATEQTEWDEEIATTPDGMTQAEFRRAVEARLADCAAIPQRLIPPSLDVTVPIVHKLLQKDEE